MRTRMENRNIKPRLPKEQEIAELEKLIKSKKYHINKIVARAKALSAECTKANAAKLFKINAEIKSLHIELHSHQAILASAEARRDKLKKAA